MYFTIEKKLKKYSNTFLGPLAQLVEHFPFNTSHNKKIQA